MDFRKDPEEETFRSEVRAFLRDALPARLARRGLAGEFSSAVDTLEWQTILHAKGWGAPSWPIAHGGTGWTPIQVMIFEEEAKLAGAPTQNIQGLDLLGPVVIAFGTPAQQASLLPPLLRGEALWCQGFSEPGAGSDLAALRTTGRIDGDTIVVDGSKIWTTSAHEATHIFLLVRTDKTERKHDGISFVVGSMSTPGITVRPIPSIDGDHHLNETFLDGVRLPSDALIGDPGDGWTIARFLLNNERITGLPGLKAAVARLGRLCDAVGAAGRLPSTVARERASVDLELRAVDMLARRLLSLPRDGSVATSVSSSTFKIALADLYQRATRATIAAGGARAVLAYVEPDSGIAAAGDYFYSRAVSIYGGANEIQKNVIGRALLRG